MKCSQSLLGYIPYAAPRKEGVLMPRKHHKYHFSISIGLSTAFVFVILLIACSLVFLTNYMVKELIFQDIQTQLRDLASVGTLLVDGDLHKEITKPEQENEAAYLSIKQKLYELKMRSTGVRYVYTMRETQEGDLVFVVDAEQDAAYVSHVGDVYDDATTALVEAFKNKAGIYIDDTFTTDQWGTWVSGFAPFYTSDGKFEGILGIDISAQHVKDYQTKTLRLIFIFTLIIIIFILILAMFISKRITTPLALLEKDIDKIQHLELNEETEAYTAFREINSMNNTINNMKRALKSFRKYVPAELVAQLIDSHEEAVLHVERKNITMLFSDIENFTVLAESISSADLIEIMSGYFGGLSQIILDNRGVVDKYIGDAIMAFWGAPMSLENREYYACKTALECMAYLKTFNETLRAKGLPEVHTRMGIHTGEALVGNIGYDMRLNYTAIGDNVNLASRIEGINKFYHTKIMISETVYRQVARQVNARKLDCVVVKGKKTGIDVYELISLRTSEQASPLELVTHYEEAMTEFYARHFEQALILFERILENYPEDGPAQIQCDLCRIYIETPPEEGWTGLRIFDTK